MTEFVYTLALEHGKYYCGMTRDLPYRIAQHWCTGQGAKWTTLHKPIRVLSVQDCPQGQGKALETACFSALCCQFGWSNCRGASWTQLEMPNAPSFIRKLEMYSPSKQDQLTADSSGKPDQPVFFATPSTGELMKHNSAGESSSLCSMVGSGEI